MDLVERRIGRVSAERDLVASVKCNDSSGRTVPARLRARLRVLEIDADA